jgi:hypothetical protein
MIQNFTRLCTRKVMQTLEIAMAELVGLRQNVLDRQPEFAKGEPVRRRPGQGLPVGGQVGDPRPGLIHQGLEQVFGLSRAGGELRQPVRSDEETADPQGVGGGEVYARGQRRQMGGPGREVRRHRFADRLRRSAKFDEGHQAVHRVVWKYCPFRSHSRPSSGGSSGRRSFSGLPIRSPPRVGRHGQWPLQRDSPVHPAPGRRRLQREHFKLRGAQP